MTLSAETLRRRISRVQALVAYLDRLQPVDLPAYEADIALQLRIERVAQLLSQSLMDIGATLLERQRGFEGTPDAKAAGGANETLMAGLAQAGILDAELAQRLADVPELADTLVHEFVEVDSETVWRIWTERRADFSAAAGAFANFLTRNKVRLQL